MNTKTNKVKKEESSVNLHFHYDESLDSENLFRIVEISRHDFRVSLRSFAKNEDMNFLVDRALKIFDYAYYRGGNDDVS